MSKPPGNAKFKIGDEVLLINYHINEAVAHARILDWRGGGVAPYRIEITESLRGNSYSVGERLYKSGRDMKLLWRDDRAEEKDNSLTTDEKLDLLLEHLGLRIEIEPQVVKIVSDEKASD